MYQRRSVLEVQDWGDKWQVIYVVEFVPEKEDKNQEIWAEQHGHCFPKDVFEWRAAEYGIDPSDMNTLVDLVLAEPFAGAVLPGEGLHDAPTIEDARRMHVARCTRAKLAARLSTRGSATREGGPLRKVHDHSPMDREAMTLKKEIVRRGRSGHKFSSGLPQEDRRDALRNSLEGGRKNRD